MLKISVHSASQHASVGPAHLTSSASEVHPHLIFRVSTQLYAVSLLQIREVRSAPSLTRIAHAPNYVLGVTGIRGEIVPVIDFKERFMLDRISEAPQQSIILVSEIDSRKVGIQVDSVREVVDIDLNTVQPVPRTTVAIDLRYLTGMAQINDEIILIVNLQKLLQPEELHAVEQSTQEVEHL